jgi:hypothetical protein
MRQDDDIREVQGVIAFGLDAQQFLNTSLGKYLTVRANREIQIALTGLADVEPTDADGVRKLQTEIRVAENFLKWMDEAINEGKQAERQFEAERQAER